ncbi:MAG: alpha/beta hydrolase [Cyclobacteriaceae bacterium]
MMKKFLSISVMLTIAHVSLSQLPTLASGSLDRIANFPSQYVTERNVDVWLPDGYDSTAAYPVLYMHDGNMLFDSTTTWNGQEWGMDEALGQLIANDEIPPCILVAIWNVPAERKPDYTPQKPFLALPQDIRDSLYSLESYRQKLFPVAVRSDGYLKFIVNELKPFVDSKYATKPDRDNTFIMGSSMGGLISMYAFMEYPEVFGGAACLSTHWTLGYAPTDIIPERFRNYMIARVGLIPGRKLYMDHGTTTLDALYPPYQKLFDEALEPYGISPTAYQSKIYEGAAHTEVDWGKRIAIPLIFLMRK